MPQSRVVDVTEIMDLVIAIGVVVKAIKLQPGFDIESFDAYIDRVLAKPEVSSTLAIALSILKEDV